MKIWSYLCISQELSYNATSEHMLPAQNKELAPTSGKDGPGTIEDEPGLPMQIKKPVRRHNKPKKAQDYVVSPEGHISKPYMP